MGKTISEVVESLPKTLRQRMNRRNEFPTKAPPSSFVLYIPTVVLRKQHNPAFALACHLANSYNAPLVVLAVVLDDAHLPAPFPDRKHKPIVLTARRTAFVLEALQSASKEWQDHGAGVAIRVHGPQKARTPHALTLSRQALAVVTDEPFVHPYRALCDSLERATSSAKVPFFSVDGSTTVPPVSILQSKFRDLPNKAWKWEERTKAHRKGHIFGAVRDGHLDAPELMVKLDADFFLASNGNYEHQGLLQDCIPSEWKLKDTPCPGKRPWTVSELGAISNIKEWVMVSWPGIDTSVKPCSQTHGSSRAGWERWEHFRLNHLQDYAKSRNNITRPHSVSRMSCYLNYGVVSIFQIIYQLWELKEIGKPSYKGACKFEDEIVKWREMSYAHAFASPEYNGPSAVPPWASHWMAHQQQQDASPSSYSLVTLELGQTEDATWNAMQQYLVETGELHNNARMTWGTTMVHWQMVDCSLATVLDHMVYINDRYALDGLSPPSYAGLLWCFGWCDKPSNNGAISAKPASRYRTGGHGFQQARQALFTGCCNTPPAKRQLTDSFDDENKEASLSLGCDRTARIVLNPAQTKKAKLTGIKNPPLTSPKLQKPMDAYFKSVG